MNTRHTPGPWVAQKDGYSVLIEDWLIGTPGGRPDEVAVCSKRDAALIAAAPELLEACQTFAEWLRREEAGFPAEIRFNTPEGEAKWREWFDENLRICDLAQKQARAAIAKATGGEA